MLISSLNLESKVDLKEIFLLLLFTLIHHIIYLSSNSVCAFPNGFCSELGSISDSSEMV